MNFYKRFDGAVSITIVLNESENKVVGSSPRLRVRDIVKSFSFFSFYFFFFFFFFFFFLLSQRCRNIFVIYMFAEKSIFGCIMHMSRLYISRMAKLVWRYSDDAGAIIENVYKFCMKEKKPGMTLSLNRV